MKFVCKSPLTGKLNEREIDVTPEQYENWLSSRKLIQDALPHLSADDREFLLTGYTPEDWDAIFPDEDN